MPPAPGVPGHTWQGRSPSCPPQVEAIERPYDCLGFNKAHVVQLDDDAFEERFHVVLTKFGRKESLRRADERSALDTEIGQLTR